LRRPHPLRPARQRLMRASASPMLAAALLALAGCGGEPAPLPEGAVAVQDRKLDEMSGLAASRAQPGVLWAINDSGNAGRLFRLGEDGSALGRVDVDGAWLRDSESLAYWNEDGRHWLLIGVASWGAQPGGRWPSNAGGTAGRLFRLGEDGSALGRVDVDGAWLRDSESLAYWNEDGRHWLLIGDVGDNRGWRGSVVVHAVPEPAPGQEDVDIAWSLRFRYPDGARDAEAITVDAQAGDLLVLSKRDRPARLYRVPLSARHGDGIVQAEYLASLPEEAIAGAVTSLDLSEDGRDLLVLSYGGLYRWHRLPGE